MRIQTLLFFLSLGILLGGCGPGLCVGESSGGCLTGSEVTPRLLLSGLDGLTIRKNDCYPVTLSAQDSSGNPITNINAAVNISTSSGVVIYSSLEGCQTYDSLFEKSAFTLTPTSPQIVFYFRSDTEGAVSLSASTSASLGLADATQPITVQYTAFDGAKGPSSTVEAIVLDAAGRSYLGGSFQTYDDSNTAFTARLNADGSHDTSFAPVGTGLDDYVHELALQSDGKLIVGGQFTSYNGTSRPYIARLNSDGSLDTGFSSTGSGLNGQVYAVSVQSDGKVLAGGGFSFYHGTSRAGVARLNSNGSLDTSFALAGSGFNNQVYSLSLQSDGRVLVGGLYTSYNSTARSYIARLNTNGSLDTSFAQTGSGLDGLVSTVSLQSDGKVVVGGSFASYNGTARPYIARLNSNGTLDTSFAPASTGFNSATDCLFVQSDGRVVVGGQFTSYDGTSRRRIARLNIDGSLDTSFASTGTAFNSFVYALAVQSDAKVMVGGSFTSFNGTSQPSIARINSDGTLDSTFGSVGSGFNNGIQTLSLQSDGKVLVGGQFTSYSGTSRRYIARLLSDGSLDSGFTQTGSGLDGVVYGVATQNDGKVVVGGNFTAYNGTSNPNIARLKSDGSLDTTFRPTGSGLDGLVSATALQSDGKVLVGGQFSSYNGTPSPFFARLNSDGSLDTGFTQTGSGLDASVMNLSLQNDGKVVVAGLFSAYNAVSRTYVARLNTNGSLDTSFALSGSGFNGSIFALGLQSDGKLLVGGDFTSYNGTTRNRIARLNSDGSLDASFAPSGTGLNSTVITLCLQTNGKVAIGGDFTSYDGTARFRIARLNSNGSLDTGFGSSTAAGFNGFVFALAQQIDGKILTGGMFSTFNSSTTNYLARLTYIGTLD